VLLSIPLQREKSPAAFLASTSSVQEDPPISRFGLPTYQGYNLYAGASADFEFFKYVGIEISCPSAKYLSPFFPT
jgi:hypothetical protein